MFFLCLSDTHIHYIYIYICAWVLITSSDQKYIFRKSHRQRLKVFCKQHYLHYLNTNVLSDHLGGTRAKLCCTLHGCWRATCPPVCYSRVNYSVVWPADKLKSRDPVAEVTFRIRLVWRVRWWWWCWSMNIGISQVQICRQLVESLLQTDSPLSDPYRWMGHNHPLFSTCVWRGKTTYMHMAAAVNCAHNFTNTDGCCSKLCGNYKLLQKHANTWECVACVDMHIHTHTPNAAVVCRENPLICLQACEPLLASAI